MRRLLPLLSIAAMLLTPLAVPGAHAQEGDVPLISGRFYTQAVGRPGLGFAVVDDEYAQFFSALAAFGGPEVIGYPISRRFVSGDLVTQVFQRQVMQMAPEGVVLLPTLDVLSSIGLDSWLAKNYS